ncbi:MAG: S-methyl-5-thioribose-1-phosphate isomerase [Clostridiales bacterium]|nr:S-methyl-5-thioribose-1-phosphate isomerase [Clostridiales bacterium]
MITNLNGETLRFDRVENCLCILDQTKLPCEEKLLYLKTQEEIYDAIKLLKVRGAPAIGVAAAAGAAVIANSLNTLNRAEFDCEMDKAIKYLASSRPTAVNLFWALERMKKIIDSNPRMGVEPMKKLLSDEAERMHSQDIEICRRIGENGADLITDGDGILTHCNAGRLAAVKYGTALAPVYIACEQGKRVKVYSDETRPLLQGARLTCWELTSAGIDTTVICDNMAASIMAKGAVNAVFVGADRIAANFDTANKIGTYSVAILAKHFGIPFYVCAPESTFDKNTPDGTGIPVEERAGEEITQMWYERRMAPEGVKTYNPAFDVTPHGLITAFVTENGIIKP